MNDNKKKITIKDLEFHLDKWVLVTLIGSTTVSVFAIIRAIIKGIFKE